VTRLTRVLVTGFDGFGAVAANPSSAVVRALAASPGISGAALATEVLPTVYATAGDRLLRLLAEKRPAVVVALGVATSRPGLCLERFALNVDDAALPDNLGAVRRGAAIDPDGPAALVTRIDLDATLAALGGLALPAAISNHAGSFVCNHVYYRALHAVRRSRRRIDCLFVHLPMVAPDSLWTLDAEIAAIRLIIAELLRQRSARSPRPARLRAEDAGASFIGRN
jgi:pyroglutamyl-peptidase